MIAKKVFKKGEAIFSEAPIVSTQFSWNKFYNYRACEFCMRPLEDALENVRRLTENSSISLPFVSQCCTTNKQTHCKCEKCGVEYCSDRCRHQAFLTYHQTLCSVTNSTSYNLIMEFWRSIHLPPETTSIELILKLLAIIKQVKYYSFNKIKKKIPYFKIFSI